MRLPPSAKTSSAKSTTALLTVILQLAYRPGRLGIMNRVSLAREVVDRNAPPNAPQRTAAEVSTEQPYLLETTEKSRRGRVVQPLTGGGRRAAGGLGGFLRRPRRRGLAFDQSRHSRHALIISGVCIVVGARRRAHAHARAPCGAATKGPYGARGERAAAKGRGPPPVTVGPRTIREGAARLPLPVYCTCALAPNGDYELPETSGILLGVVRTEEVADDVIAADANGKGICRRRPARRAGREEQIKFREEAHGAYSMIPARAPPLYTRVFASNDTVILKKIIMFS
ncbi:hypothetical protein EVAR_60921_1 [Eumeta japonica]|uniref:Uncharacterized protein n=1 Tax=Eumeta variegata TaxID=151549 RepID=A0A4C1ZJ64_EUMVA|nr:hypothetical protein EVAR_60921_1 [Eumeta japonica]